MKIQELPQLVSPELSQKLSQFEALFNYPLGENERFSIEHGPDFTAFFRAIGNSKTLILQYGEEVIGALSIAIRTVHIEGNEKKVAYLGDLKVHPRYQVLSNREAADNRAGREPDGSNRAAPSSKLEAYLNNLFGQDVDSAYCVVMDGTQKTPDVYTSGRRIPKFEPVANIQVVRFVAKAHNGSPATSSTGNDGYCLYKSLSSQSHCHLADAALRSTMNPEWFCIGQNACGMLEDTRRAKRLYLNTGNELLSAHLSYFAFNDVEAAVEILNIALDRAHKLKFPAVFVALSNQQYLKLKPFLNGLQHSASPATVYATDKVCALLPVNSAEI